MAAEVHSLLTHQRSSDLQPDDLIILRIDTLFRVLDHVARQLKHAINTANILVSCAQHMRGDSADNTSIINRHPQLCL